MTGSCTWRRAARIAASISPPRMPATGRLSFVVLILGAIVVGLALLVESIFAPPFWVHVVLWTPMIIGGSIALLAAAEGGDDRAAIPPSPSGRRALMGRRALFWPSAWAGLGFAILIGLGIWQVQRLGWKEGLIAQRQGALAAAPVALPETIEAAAALEFHPVRASGVFQNDRELYLNAQSVGRGDAGFDVVTPLSLPDGSVLLVNRGFVPTDKKAPETRADGRDFGRHHRRRSLAPRPRRQAEHLHPRKRSGAEFLVLCRSRRDGESRRDRPCPAVLSRRRCQPQSRRLAARRANRDRSSEQPLAICLDLVCLGGGSHRDLCPLRAPASAEKPDELDKPLWRARDPLSPPRHAARGACRARTGTWRPRCPKAAPARAPSSSPR